MSDDFEQIGSFLSRWSRRKLEKTGNETDGAPEAPAADATAAKEQAWQTASPEPGAPLQDTREEPLPSVESLTPESDFTRFMRPDVDPGTKTAALKQLFKDPHFNVMDGLDTYIDDYSIPDPIPAAMLKTMYQARQHLFSDEEKAAADAADAAAEEKALADAADALDAEQLAAADDLHRALQSADTGPQPADPAAPDHKDA